jgi:hypothetical protein
MAARLCSKASPPTRASTANARSRPWPAKRRPWATPSWPWAPPRSRTATLSQHRPPALAPHETGVPGPVGERGKCLHTPAQCPPEDPILHATPPAHPATPPPRTGLVPWEVQEMAGTRCSPPCSTALEPPLAGTSHVGPLYPFSSFFSAVRNRQSVPWAIIFCGLLLSIPTSCRRSA